MDLIDREILHLLQSDATRSSREVGDAVGPGRAARVRSVVPTEESHVAERDRHGEALVATPPRRTTTGT